MSRAEDVVTAADLLVDREEVATKLSEFKAAKRCQIMIEKEMSYGSKHFSNATELDVTPSIRKLLTAGLEEALAEIDKKLRALGVEPPKETEVV